MNVNLGLQSWRYVGFMKLAVLIPLLCPPGVFNCGSFCRLTPSVAAPETVPTCCHPSTPVHDVPGGPCTHHHGAPAPSLGPGCCCVADSHLMPGSLPRRASETSSSRISATDVAPPEYLFSAEASFAGAALSGYSPPGRGSRDTYLRIANLRI